MNKNVYNKVYYWHVKYNEKITITVCTEHLLLLNKLYWLIYCYKFYLIMKFNLFLSTNKYILNIKLINY